MIQCLGFKEEEGDTCQTRRRRFLALALRVVVSFILFQTSPPESCFFTISITLVPQNAPPIFILSPSPDFPVSAFQSHSLLWFSMELGFAAVGLILATAHFGPHFYSWAS